MSRIQNKNLSHFRIKSEFQFGLFVVLRYGSAMGVQTTFVNHPLGAVVGGLASPIHFAEGSYSNFDPDSWVIINSMTMARYNDTFVLSEAKKLLDTTILGMCSETVLEGDGKCVPGQMPLAMYPKGKCVAGTTTPVY